MATTMMAFKFNPFISRDVIDNRDIDSPPYKDHLEMPTLPRSASGTVFSSEENLNREDVRRKTFGPNWPHRHLDPDLLARTGFYFVGPHDNVKCFFCKVEIGRFEENDEEVTEHQRWSNNCPLLRRRSTQNVPIDAAALERVLPPVTIDVCGTGVDVRHNTVSEGSFDVTPEANLSAPIGMTNWSASVPMSTMQSSTHGPEHPEFALESARLRSFEDWPKTMKQKPQQLSDAGFFYTMKGDRVKCFSCGGGLRDWDEMDVPWEQHARWFGQCEYLLLVKGQEYVDEIMARKPDEDDDTTHTALHAGTPTSESNAHRNVESSIAAALAPNALETGTSDLSGSIDCAKFCDSKLCKICYSCEYNTAFMPCGHVVACGKCASSVTKCPLCRKPFERVMRVYFS